METGADREPGDCVEAWQRVLRVRLQSWQWLVVIAAAAFALVYGIDRTRRGAIQTDGELIGLLPRGNTSVLFANVTALRRMGVLSLVAGANGQDADYASFVQETGFDYSKDIDAIAAASVGDTLYFVVRGRFEWRRLRAYAQAHNGSCDGDHCSAPTSKASRWASFFPIDRNVLGLAVASDRTAAYNLSPRRDRVAIEMPPQPVWMTVSPVALKDGAALPQALRLFAAPLAEADRIALFAGGTEAAWRISLEAECDSEAKARSLRVRLEDRTSLLKRALLREGQKPNPADLTGLMADGVFESKGRRVTGWWPLHKELLNMLR